MQTKAIRASTLSYAILRVVALCLFVSGLAGTLAAQASGEPKPAHGIAMHGGPALPPDFSHLPYANPDARKGGRVTLGMQGTFDSFNPFNLKAGSAAQGLVGPVYQTLMFRSLDEPFTLYGLIAQSVETNAERSYVTFRIDPRARFSDGSPLTSDDVRFSFELLGKKGRPQHRAAFQLVKAMETPDAGTVRFDLSGANDRELPLILALMPVLSRKHTNAETFDNATLAIPVGSGPYIIKQMRPGQSITLERNRDYWAKDLPVHRGFYNFDEIRFEYFRDGTTFYEALKAGLVEYREENDPTKWLTGYDIPPVADGRLVKSALPLGGAKGMQGLAFNTRRAVFQDVRVREALGLLFDFEWINANLYGGLYRRTKSFFDETELAATGKPADERERKLLEAYPGVVRADILEGKWLPPVSDGSGLDRNLARRAMELFGEAGFSLSQGQLRNKAGRQLTFEIMVTEREQERLALIFAQSLKRLGIDARVRQVDLVQYQRRRQKFDFDMTFGAWIASNSPGNEQRNRWSSQSAKQESSFNLTGAQSPALDGLIAAMLKAVDPEDFRSAVRAYDRVLQSGFYIVPLYHKPQQWFVHSRDLDYPRRLPRYGSPLFGQALETWWRKTP
jgi:peptide/nickel transport system substrate-binding protein